MTRLHSPRSLMSFVAAAAAAFAGCTAPAGDARASARPDLLERIRSIHEQAVFADIHAHPSRFHRGEAERIEREELERYRRGNMDLVVAKISTDAPYGGGYIRRDGTRVERGEHQPPPGYPFRFTLDRLERILKTIADGDAVLATGPQAVLDARARGEASILAALEGADGLEGRIENLRPLHERGIRMVQFVHFRVNELGHIQTDSTPGGLTPFGREVVREMNRLGMVIDLAHANSETIRDVLASSQHPVVFSHTGAHALHQGARYLTDDDIRAIAAAGGVIGIWPNGEGLPHVDDIVRHIDHVRSIAGIDHIAIGSDLRGMSSYSEGFGEEADFTAIAAALIEHGYSDEGVGKIMGGNFFRIWQSVTAGISY